MMLLITLLILQFPPKRAAGTLGRVGGVNTFRFAKKLSNTNLRPPITITRDGFRRTPSSDNPHGLRHNLVLLTKSKATYTPH